MLNYIKDTKGEDEKMAKGLLTLISGSSGVGKNTVIAKLLEENKDMQLLRSCTSRAIRVDDKIQDDGRYTYDFLTKEEFEERIAKDDIVEYDIFGGNYYGVLKDSIYEAINAGKIGIKDITVKGVISCKTKFEKSINIVSVFLTLEKSKLKKRLILRETKDIANRMKHYKMEQKSIPLYDYCILNDDLDLTLNKMRAIMNHINGEEILIGEDLSKFSEDKLEKLVKRLKANKKVGKVKVAEKDGKIYVVSGYMTYLASIKSHIPVTKYFVDDIAIEESDQEYWKQLKEDK